MVMIKQQNREQDYEQLLVHRLGLKARAEAEIKALSDRWAVKLAEVDEAIRVMAHCLSLSPLHSPHKPATRLLKSTTQLVRDAIAQTQGEFSVSAIVQLINGQPGCQVSERELRTALWRMVKRGEIAISQQGRGQTPNTYVVPGNRGKPQNKLPLSERT
jgi:hypothetical protein